MSKIEINNGFVEYFTNELVKDSDRPLMVMAFDEDDLVYLKGLTVGLLELTELIGSEPPIELLSLQSSLSESLSQFYGED